MSAPAGLGRGAPRARAPLRHADLPAGAGRVRARRGRAPLGRGRASEYIDLFAGPLGPQRRPLPPADRRRDQRAGGHARPAPPTSSTRGRRCADRAARRVHLGGRAFLCNSGTEANECAIKLVRKHARAAGSICPRSSSSTTASTAARWALAATPRLADEDLFGPLPPGFVAVPRDDPEALRAAVGSATAAVMLEPIQGEAGVFPIGDDVLIAAREACDRPVRCSSSTRSRPGWGGPGRSGRTSRSRSCRT